MACKCYRTFSGKIENNASKYSCRAKNQVTGKKGFL